MTDPVGPPAAVPVATTAVPRPPRKWLGRKGGLLIVALGTVLWFGTVLFELAFNHVNEAPTNALFIGAFTVSSAFIYTMAYRLRPSDGLSVSRLLIAFLVGGILATTLAAPFNALDNLWSGGSSSEASLTSLSLAGVVEELVKILIVMLVSVRLPQKTVRNGLFLGGAVGFGFAAIEDVQYARQAWNIAYADHAAAFPAEIFNVVSRDVIGIFGHPLFTALLAAAVFAAVRNGRFRITWRVVLAYLGVAFAHGLFDLSGELVYRLTFSNILSQVAFYFVVVLEAVVLSLIWRRVSRRANRQLQLVLRPATGADLDFLAEMLVEAANWDGKRETTRASVEADPHSWRYLAGWQRPTDFGVIASDGTEHVGAAWARFGTATDAGYGHVTDDVPEVTIAVSPAVRGRGVGRMMLAALTDTARGRGLPGMSLSVEDGNQPARKLYELSGFVVVDRNGNSDTMLLTLEEPAPVLPSAEPAGV
jgi:RsiW-degrading membrane proteinase PrsW (M82 family)/ribosomal protein S18 acetylase RimI-like enzyme